MFWEVERRARYMGRGCRQVGRSATVSKPARVAIPFNKLDSVDIHITKTGNQYHLGG